VGSTLPYDRIDANHSSSKHMEEITHTQPICDESSSNTSCAQLTSAFQGLTRVYPTERNYFLRRAIVPCRSTCQRSSTKTLEKRIAIVSATLSAKAFECEEQRDSEFNFQELDTRTRLVLESPTLSHNRPPNLC
jgi:hypothetical protein